MQAPGLEQIQQKEKEFAARQDDPELRRELALSYIQLADQIYEATINSPDPNQVAAPLGLYPKAFELKAEGMDMEYLGAFHKAAIVTSVLGLTQQGHEFVRQAFQYQEKVTEKHPLGHTDIRILATRSATLTNIGHLMGEPELIEKKKQLGWMPPYRCVLLAERGKVVNPTGMNYWRKYVCAITDPSLVRRLLPQAPHLEYSSFWAELPEGHIGLIWDATIAVQKEWEKQGRKPLVKLTQEHELRAKMMFQQMGIPEDSWFVTLHVRDESYDPATGRTSMGDMHAKRDRIRDASIESYIPAIEEITSRGGWVIRMGDRRMQPLPPMRQVIDYPFTNFKCDWMDVYLGAACKFFVATASGPLVIPLNFGKPVVLTNAMPSNSHAPSGQDIYLPKLLRSVPEDRLLSFREMFSPPHVYTYHANLFSQRKIEVIDNTPQEICEAVIEMFDRIDGKAEYTDKDEELQRRYNELVQLHEPLGLASRAGREYLRRYEHLL